VAQVPCSTPCCYPHGHGRAAFGAIRDCSGRHVSQGKAGDSGEDCPLRRGDGVVAVLTRPVRATDKIIVPSGSRLQGRVETIQPATRANEGRVRLVFREILFPDGRRMTTWITNSFGAAAPKRNDRYALYMGIGAVAGGLIGGRSGRVAGVIGGTLTGFVIAGNRSGPALRDLTLKAGQEIRLQLGEDLTLAEN